MQTFTEWSQFRTEGHPLKKWIFISDKGLEEARAELDEMIKPLFREFEIGEGVTSENGKSIFPIDGETCVTIFELEKSGIVQAD